MSSELTSDIDIYNEEIPRIERALQRLNEKVGTRQDVEDYRQEIIGRFAEIGLKVDVDGLVPTVTCKECKGSGEFVEGIMCLHCRGAGHVNEGGEPEFVGFRINIVGRVEDHAMDWEKFGEQIQKDILDIGEGGTVQ